MSTAEPKLSVFLLSHNKNGYVQEAVQSVLDQDYVNYELHILENSTDDTTALALLSYLYGRDSNQLITFWDVDVPEEVRATKYVPAWLINNYYPYASGDDVILYLSDDDLFAPGIFRAVAGAFACNPTLDALYFTLLRVHAQAPGQPYSAPWMVIAAAEPRGAGQVDCQIDGGQVAYRKKVLDTIGQPYFDTGLEGASHCDGGHLEKIAAHYTFAPLPYVGVIHRHTPLSTWTQ